MYHSTLGWIVMKKRKGLTEEEDRVEEEEGAVAGAFVLLEEGGHGL